MKLIIEFLKSLCKGFYFYTALGLGAVSAWNNFTPYEIPLLKEWSNETYFLFIVISFLITIFKMWEREYHRQPRARVLSHYHINRNVIEFEIKNVGTDYARDVVIKLGSSEFEKKYEKRFPNLIPQIAPNEELRFFVGVFDKNYTKFSVKVTYTSVGNGRFYTEEQMFDFSSLAKTSYIETKEEKILKELTSITKALKNQNDTLKNANEILKNGINVRNSELLKYGEDEIKNIIKGLIDARDLGENDFRLYPFVNDLIELMKLLRYKILSKSVVSEKDREILKQIKLLIDATQCVGSGNEIERCQNELKKLL